MFQTYGKKLLNNSTKQLKSIFLSPTTIKGHPILDKSNKIGMRMYLKVLHIDVHKTATFSLMLLTGTQIESATLEITA